MSGARKSLCGLAPSACVRLRLRTVRPFRDAVGEGLVEFDSPSAELVEALRALTGRYPGLEEHLWESGALSPYVNIYVNGQSVPVDEAAKWRLQEGDEILFLLPITGG